MSAIKKAVLTAKRPLRKRSLENAIRAGLPSQLHTPLRFLATEERSPAAEAAAERVEAVRREHARRPGDVTVFYSPKPNSAGEDTSAEARPEKGEEQRFTYERILTQTSIAPYWGSFLQQAMQASSADLAIELGSCAGIAACYLSQAEQQPRVITVEGSQGLSELARETTGAVAGDRVEVVNALFDDALDDLLPTLTPGKVGFAWIDGHHERVATIHYLRRLLPTLAPGAFVLYDDISWSADMRRGWDEVLADFPGFSHTVDLQRLGLGIWAGGDVKPNKWDLRDLTGLPKRVKTPAGWS